MVGPGGRWEAWEAMKDWRYWILRLIFFWRVWGVCSEIEVNEGFFVSGRFKHGSNSEEYQ